ncbi:MAG: hypothetical protein IPH33_13975 [Bacteroidetes bacterium]|nr:hypothetical protein [Bacteroidota bacterium]
MSNLSKHTFHIPVMGIAFTIDTPIKLAHFGISSVVSIIEDQVIEDMRKLYSSYEDEEFQPIPDTVEDYRSKRITAYLNLLDKIVLRKTEDLRKESFESGYSIQKYFEMLPGDSEVKSLYYEMRNSEGKRKSELQDMLRASITSGAIDVNIMTKLDKTNYTKEGEQLSAEYSDAVAALRGFANSKLSSSVVFSAGMNPRLYGYCETVSDFYPDDSGLQRKKIILKVSDFRSAMIQGKFLAKKGLWISEFRIESGLNCGGHAFATDGLLLGPILEEFKMKRTQLTEELFAICNSALAERGKTLFEHIPEVRITVQGGIGTYQEDKFLRDFYSLDGTGWGSPFLLVPEATNVDEATLHQLARAKQEDFYLSNASPLGVPFNNFSKSTSEIQRRNRIQQGRPGSPCYKKFLSGNTEFTTQPICTASRQYQDLKIKQINEKTITLLEKENEVRMVVEKECLCEGLTSPAYIKNSVELPHKLKAVAICPGPNLAFFSGVFSLEEMVGHIYGRKDVLNAVSRPNMFVNELNLYVDYLKNEISKNIASWTIRQEKQYNTFKENLIKGISYYKSILTEMKSEKNLMIERMKSELEQAELKLKNIYFPELV